MAISKNNVQNVQFLRNGSVFAPKEGNTARQVALDAMEGQKATLADGSVILGRYQETNGVVKTLVGFAYVSGDTKTLTVFDVDGAGADVDEKINELRDEINGKLGTDFISSSNTVEKNLTALSGKSTDASGVTSVWGAKNYADAKISDLDYSGVTTGDGVYVTNVTQSDGIVSATTATLPSVTNTKEAKKVVVSVSEDKGLISIEKGTISSTAETMVLTDNSDGGVNFEVNIDGVSIVQDANKKLKVADTALTQYYGDEKTIHAEVDSATNKKTFNTLLKIVKNANPSETEVKEEYFLADADGTAIAGADRIKIYKDSSLYSVYLGHVDDTITSADDPTVVQGSGDTALCFIYLKTDGKYKLVAVNIEEFIEENEFASGVTWDSTDKKVKGVVDTSSEKDSSNNSFLTVGADGFKVDGIKAEIDTKINALDATVTDATSGNHVTITIEEVDGKLVQSGLTIEENDIASATDLAALSAKTVTNVKSTNSSIGIATAKTSDDTVEVDVITDADKIQMSGFSAGNTTALSGIATSDSIATAFEKTNAVITENERVTAEALNDLDGRLDVVEDEYISGVSVNGKAVTLNNKVAPISIEAATSAVTATSTEAIVVDTDANGNITLGISSIDCGFYA